MSKAFRKMAILSAGLITASMAWVATAAEPASDSTLVTAASLATVPHRVVQVADLNLSHPAGVATLETRIRSAVELMCGKASAHDYRSWSAIRSCRSASYADAMAQVEDRIASVSVAAR